MGRLLRGEVPPGGNCDIMTLVREAGIDRTAFYGNRPYAHLRTEFEDRLRQVQQTDQTPDPRIAQITRLKADIDRLKERLAKADRTRADLTDFRGNTFVVAAVVVMLPFLDRPIALPVLARLWRKGGPAKTAIARELIETIAAHVRGRTVHVVADGAYLCTELRRLPPHVTLTGPLRSNASLWHVHPDLDNPPRLRGRGRPRVYGARIGTPDDLAAATPGVSVTVNRYARSSTIQVHHQRCLWRGVFGARPVWVLILVEPGKPGLALVTTDLTTPVAAIVERYAGRWSIEVASKTPNR
jgi:hypothetical protein